MHIQKKKYNQKSNKRIIDYFLNAEKEDILKWKDENIKTKRC